MAALDQAIANTAALREEAYDLRRQKTDLEAALASTMTAWRKDKAALENVRVAVGPKVGDLVHWSEVEVGALYEVRTYDAYHFRVVSLHTTALCCGDDDRELESYLDGRYNGTPIDALADFHEGQTHATLIARDLGSDPEAWRAAMREYSAKVGK